MTGEVGRSALPIDALWILARAALDERQRQAVVAQITPLAPEELLSALATDGLVPLAYRHLVASPAPGLSDQVAAELTAEFHRHATTRYLFTRRLRELLDALESSGVRVVPYKGAPLAIQLYGNYAMRQFGDLDLLVHPADADRANRALVAAGLESQQATSPEWTSYLQQRRHSEPFFDRSLGLPVELHWSVADRFHGVDLDVGWLMEQTETIDLIGRPTKVMTGARLLLALCLHGVKHLWERRAWIAEVAELIRQQPQLDWQAAFARADNCDLGRSLRASLLVIRDLLHVAPPDPWARQLDTDLSARRLADALAARILSDDPAHDRLLGRFRLGYLARTGITRRATFVWRVVADFSERDLRQLPDRPAGFSPWHVLQRGLRLMRQARRERAVRS